MKPPPVPAPPMAKARADAARQRALDSRTALDAPEDDDSDWVGVAASSTYAHHSSNTPSAEDEIAALDDTDIVGRGSLWDDIKINTNVEWRVFWITSILGVVPWWIFALHMFPVWQLWFGAAITAVFSSLMGPLARRQMAWDRRKPPHSVLATLRTPAGVVAVIRSFVAVPCYAAATGFDMTATFFGAAITALVGLSIVVIAEVGSINDPNQ